MIDTSGCANVNSIFWSSMKKNSLIHRISTSADYDNLCSYELFPWIDIDDESYYEQYPNLPEGYKFIFIPPMYLSMYINNTDSTKNEIGFKTLSLIGGEYSCQEDTDQSVSWHAHFGSEDGKIKYLPLVTRYYQIYPEIHTLDDMINSTPEILEMINAELQYQSEYLGILVWSEDTGGTCKITPEIVYLQNGGSIYPPNIQLVLRLALSDRVGSLPGSSPFRFIVPKDTIQNKENMVNYHNLLAFITNLAHDNNNYPPDNPGGGRALSIHTNYHTNQETGEIYAYLEGTHGQEVAGGLDDIFDHYDSLVDIWMNNLY